MATLIISNPVSGAGESRQFVEQHILPLLEDHPYQLEETTGTGSAGSLAIEFLRKNEDHRNITMVLSGGDGTVHEVVNAIAYGVSWPVVVQLAICPQGTANALYSTLFPPSIDDLSTVEYRLRSLRAFLDGGRSRRLSLTQTQFLTRDGYVTQTLFGVVVTSTALHASILHGAEHLRTSIPGIERFKTAAEENISNWYRGQVRLHSPNHLGSVQIYDPSTGLFRPLDPSNQAVVDLPGPYEYFLSTVNVDRLEPAFEITSLFTKSPPGPGEMDLIVIRPLRDPSLGSDTPESRVIFISKSWTVLREAYNRGSHVSLRYNENEVTSEGDGPLVVEYIRCGGWDWVPDESDSGAHIVCVDGTIIKMDVGDKASCRVLPDTANARFTVCTG